MVIAYLCNYVEQQFFHSAIRDGNLKLIKKLLKNGVDVNSRHYLGWYAIHVAVVNGHMGLVKLLLDNGADVNIKDEFSSAQRIATQERTSSIVG